VKAASKLFKKVTGKKKPKEPKKEKVKDEDDDKKE
jgi:hypothetical protein